MIQRLYFRSVCFDSGIPQLTKCSVVFKMSQLVKGKEQKQFSFDYNGVSVQFPFPPYDIQKDYMRMVIDSIQNRKNAMLESPTGTGKVFLITLIQFQTLSLLCSALAAIDFRMVLAHFFAQIQTSYIPKQYSDHLKSIETSNSISDKVAKGMARKISPSFIQIDCVMFSFVSRCRRKKIDILFSYTHTNKTNYERNQKNGVPTQVDGTCLP